MSVSIEEIYRQHIEPLPPMERMQLLKRIAEDLARSERIQIQEKPQRSIMELHGLGAEIWEGVDAQEYVNKLRDEWNHRP